VLRGPSGGSRRAGEPDAAHGAELFPEEEKDAGEEAPGAAGGGDFFRCCSGTES